MMCIRLQLSDTLNCDILIVYTQYMYIYVKLSYCVQTFCFFTVLVS